MISRKKEKPIDSILLILEKLDEWQQKLLISVKIQKTKLDERSPSRALQSQLQPH